MPLFPAPLFLLPFIFPLTFPYLATPTHSQFSPLVTRPPLCPSCFPAPLFLCLLPFRLPRSTFSSSSLSSSIIPFLTWRHPHTHSSTLHRHPLSFSPLFSPPLPSLFPPLFSLLLPLTIPYLPSPLRPQYSFVTPPPLFPLYTSSLPSLMLSSPFHSLKFPSTTLSLVIFPPLTPLRLPFPSFPSRSSPPPHSLSLFYAPLPSPLPLACDLPLLLSLRFPLLPLRLLLPSTCHHLHASRTPLQATPFFRGRQVKGGRGARRRLLPFFIHAAPGGATDGLASLLTGESWSWESAKDFITDGGLDCLPGSASSRTKE
ncbi:uncharacterized protein LOC126998086 isoform X2 [Eriocheir sinensis]|uniref:uncharacterized protein LOC126998086 isoform X2 n=1 Tax=Eriocheir sinensis TaxID=95602 RepID=UPI0021C7EDC3|nr:uncharacterized protein LOC126998086 isoform X2 [Eriocheir sinensis]